MSLQNLLTETIKASGPLPLSAYMALCLTHPDYGYYTTHNPIGAEGDFITAPEISQMFGELIGLWAVHEWQARGASKPFSLVEFGPGRGTLTADALHAAQLRPGFLQAMQLYMCEASPRLQAEQRVKLAPHQPHYITSVSELPAQPTFIIANEFFDALPIDQYRLTDTGWVMRTIALDENEQLTFSETSTTPPAIIAATNSRDWVEHSAASNTIMADLCSHLQQYKGAALIIDYGHLGPEGAPLAGDTLQAVRRHQYVDPLTTPGEADLTAHVDFGALAHIAHNHGCRVGYMTQGEFLTMLGIAERAAQLNDQAALARLTAPDQMGTLFKVLLVRA